MNDVGVRLASACRFTISLSFVQWVKKKKKREKRLSDVNDNFFRETKSSSSLWNVPIPKLIRKIWKIVYDFLSINSGRWRGWLSLWANFVEENLFFFQKKSMHLETCQLSRRFLVRWHNVTFSVMKRKTSSNQSWFVPENYRPIDVSQQILKILLLTTNSTKVKKSSVSVKPLIFVRCSRSFSRLKIQDARAQEFFFDNMFIWSTRPDWRKISTRLRSI